MTPEDQVLQNEAVRPLFGRDIGFALTGQGGGDFTVNAAGDWTAVEGDEALRQWIQRTLITSPGEWATLPNYGAGLRQFIKKKLTNTIRDQIVDRIRSQLIRDDRIIRVERVDIIPLAGDAGLQIVTVIIKRGESVRNTLELRTVVT